MALATVDYECGHETGKLALALLHNSHVSHVNITYHYSIVYYI